MGAALTFHVDATRVDEHHGTATRKRARDAGRCASDQVLTPTTSKVTGAT